jgi:hypothetical protein
MAASPLVRRLRHRKCRRMRDDHSCPGFADVLRSRTYALNNMNRIVLTAYLCGDGSAKSWPTSGWKLSPISSILEGFNFGLGPRCHFSDLWIPSISELV